MSKNKPKTITEITRLGGEATKRKYGSEHFARIGSKGGETSKAKYGPDYYKELSRKGVEARLKKKKLKEEKARKLKENS